MRGRHEPPLPQPTAADFTTLIQLMDRAPVMQPSEDARSTRSTVIQLRSGNQQQSTSHAPARHRSSDSDPQRQQKTPRENRWQTPYLKVKRDVRRCCACSISVKASLGVSPPSRCSQYSARRVTRGPKPQPSYRWQSCHGPSSSSGRQ